MRQFGITDAEMAHTREYVVRICARWRIEYCRSTLLDSVGSARITIDTAVSYGLLHGMARPLVHAVIIETKSGGRPTTADRLLWGAGFRPVNVSKFGLAMAVVHPQLPANRWSRALRTYTDWRPCQPHLGPSRSEAPYRAGYAPMPAIVEIGLGAEPRRSLLGS